MRQFLITFLLFALFALVLSASSHATQYSTNKYVTLPIDESVDGDYFAAGEVVEINGTVNGDVYAAGNQVLINGTVNGDVLLAGGQVTISGNVTQDARVAGGHIQLTGSIGRNLTAAGGFVSILKEAQLYGNLVLASGNANINAPISGDITATAGSLVISNDVIGDINATVDTLNINNKALLHGDLTYTSESDYNISPQAFVSGNVTRHDPKHIASIDQSKFEQTADGFKDATSTITNFFRLVILFTQIVLGLILINFIPNYSARGTDFIEKQWLKTFATGLLAVIVIPIISGLMMITIIGLPLGAITLIGYMLLLFFAQIIFSYWLGLRLLSGIRRKANKSITFLIGIGTFYVLTSISFIGVIVNILAILFGAGAILLAKQKTYKSGRKLKIF